MSENRGFALRVKYVKRGRLAFLSHLETIRSMERIIRRAHLPYAITEGFNPHMKISFGPALPVGAGSEGEYLDVRLREYVKAEEALERMQATSVADLQPVACEYIDVSADAVTVAFPVSDWLAQIEGTTVEALQPGLDALMSRGYIEVARKPKKGRGPAKVKQIAFEGRLLGEPEMIQLGNDVAVRFTTCAQDEGSLRPDKFLAAMLEPLGENAPRMASLTRLELRGL